MLFRCGLPSHRSLEIGTEGLTYQCALYSMTLTVSPRTHFPRELHSPEFGSGSTEIDGDHCPVEPADIPVAAGSDDRTVISMESDRELQAHHLRISIVGIRFWPS